MALTQAERKERRREKAQEYNRKYRLRMKKEQLALYRKRDCDSQRKKRYGLSPEQWEARFDEQGRRCAICKSPDPRSQKGWSTDHCHVGGKIRGILCHMCNVGLGAFRDNLEYLKTATDYLFNRASNVAMELAC